MNKRLAARLPGSSLLPDDGLGMEVGVARKPSPLANGSAPPLPQLIARGADPASYDIMRKPLKLEGGGGSAPGSPPDS